MPFTIDNPLAFITMDSYTVKILDLRIGWIMAETHINDENALWFSTYGLLTSERLFERFHIKFEHDELIMALKNLDSLYHQLIRVPLKNVFNGIILQQAHDYQVYAQKMFIDYLLSVEGGATETSPGAGTREDLESERLRLLEMNDSFSKGEMAHKRLIADSQADLIRLSNELRQLFQEGSKKIALALERQGMLKEESLVQEAIKVAMIYYTPHAKDALDTFSTTIAKKLNLSLNAELEPTISDVLRSFDAFKGHLDDFLSNYLDQTNASGVLIRSYRSQFYDVILRASELIKLLPNYQIDKVQDEDNRISIHFDAHLGDA